LSAVRSTPRTRGSTLLEALRRFGERVYPAHAGIDLVSMVRSL